jgi:hypothetical protein
VQEHDRGGGDREHRSGQGPGVGRMLAVWRMTRKTRLALIRYVVMLLIPSARLRGLVGGVGSRVGVRVDT